jgi:chorismate mutase/prephenate dehydratase
VTDAASDGMKDYAKNFMTELMDFSKCYQRQVLNKKDELAEKIENAIANSDKMLPEGPLVACQGVEGAYSQIAADRMFHSPNIMYFGNFEGVFAAVDKGLCKYGVLPVENSTAGSVNKIYDLMMKYNFYIVKGLRLKIDHNLLVNPGVKKSDIKEIFSHEQAIAQCSEYLKQFPADVKITVCENTALAAKMVAQSGRTDAAALSSRFCAELYGLKMLEKAVQDRDNNYTRFICISKELQILPGADKTSVMMVIGHKPGELYKILSKFYMLGINLTKLESRPISERDFEFMFYFDLETSVYSDKFIHLMSELNERCEEFKYLGSYLETI